MGRKLVCGVGVYEKGEFKCRVNGIMTREYDAWKHMLNRCYNFKNHLDCPTYMLCSVTPEWLYFQNFAKWFNENYPVTEGDYELDKDLKVFGNKVYSPTTCMILPHNVNNFTLDNNKRRGTYLHRKTKKYMSRCKNPITRKCDYLGVFDSELEAHLAWRKRKSELAYELAIIQTDAEVGSALLRWKDMLDMNIIHPY